VCFVGIADDARSVNVARADAFRLIREQGQHLIPNLPSRFVSAGGKYFKLLRCEPVCHFDRPLCRIGFKPVFVRARVAVAWRGRWLCNYAMSGSKVMACRNARVGHSTVGYHLKNDPDFAAQAEAAKAHAIDLLFTRCMQRSLEGDVEPIYWQGIVVGYIRKFDSRLQIEMLRALHAGHVQDAWDRAGPRRNRR